MARIRTIKPEFFTSEDIVSLTPLARLFYISLWCEADREGRLSWNTRTFKMRYLPGDDCSVEELAQELIDRDLIVLYEHDGREYAEIPSFKSHQVINNRESESIIPPRVKEACNRVSGEGRKEGRERKGKEPASSDEAFEEFWASYPRKVSKGDAEKAWSSIKPNEHLAEQILQAVQRAKTSEQWTKDSGKFIPYPATWLRGKCWLDEIGDPVPPNGGSTDPRFKGAK